MIDFVRMRQLIKAEERLHWAMVRERAKAEKITASLSKSGGSRGGGTSSRVEDGAIVLAVLSDEYKEITEELEQQRKELQKYLRRLEDIHRTVMKLRYMKGLSCRKIAEKLNFSEDWTYHMVKASEDKVNKLQSVDKQNRSRQRF